MRGHRTLWRAAVALLAALGLLVSLAGCGPDAPEVTSATASPRTTVATPTPVPVPSPTVAPDPPPSPTPTPRIIRDEIDRHLGVWTPCFGGKPGTSYAFVRWSGDGSAIVFSRDSAEYFGRDSDVVWVAPDGSALRQLPVVGPMTAVDVSRTGRRPSIPPVPIPPSPDTHTHRRLDTRPMPMATRSLSLRRWRRIPSCSTMTTSSSAPISATRSLSG